MNDGFTNANSKEVLLQTVLKPQLKLIRKVSRCKSIIVFNHRKLLPIYWFQNELVHTSHAIQPRMLFLFKS